MCTGMEVAALAAMAGGTYLQSESAADAADKQQNILRAGEEENQRINKAGEDTVNQFAAKTFGATERDKRYEDAANQREQSLASALSEAAASPGNAATGNVSSDFLGGQQTAAEQSAAEGAKRAKLLARTGAGGLMYGDEAMMGGQLASDLAGLSQQSRRNANYTKNAAGAVRNEGSLAGGLLSGLGSAGLNYGAGSVDSLGDGLSQGARRKIGVF